MIGRAATAGAALWGFLCLVAFGAGCTGGAEGCRQDADCPAGTYCVPASGECIFDCTVDAECPGGYRCTPRGRCEPGCAKTNGGVEACDGLDNDCDGTTDEAFPELGASCQNGGCAPGVWICAPGGGGLLCNGPLPAADDAVCDGLDDDCDGATDEDAAPRPCPLQEGVCAGAEQVCGPGGVWSDCDYGAAYTAGVDASCDRVDNDCDGETDEDGVLLLVPEAGDLADNGLDDNCNGLIDESGGILVPVTGHAGVWIDAFESVVTDSPDGSGTRYGQAGDDYPIDWPADGATAPRTLYACSLPGIVPSGHLSWYRALRACQAAGKRLCTDHEWSAACSHAQGVRYPYGSTFVPGICNDGFAGAGAPVASGSYGGCRTGPGVFDLSGNLSEWLSVFDPVHTALAVTVSGNFRGVLCDRGNNCHPADPQDDVDTDHLLDSYDCIPDDQTFEIFLPETAWPEFGARCCLDGP